MRLLPQRWSPNRGGRFYLGRMRDQRRVSAFESWENVWTGPRPNIIPSGPDFDTRAKVGLWSKALELWPASGAITHTANVPILG